MILFLVFTGCATVKHNYIWREYPIASERIPSQNSFTEGQEIRIIKGKSNDSKIILGQFGRDQYYGSEQLLTNGIVDQLTNELQNKRIKIKDTAAEKSFKITVNRSSFKVGMWMYAATIEFKVEFGNGRIKPYTVRNSSPNTVERVFNGAVALAVIEIINDPDVLTYINE